jgi:CO/xanthine dehydrogenase FAD-binding subunit
MLINLLEYHWAEDIDDALLLLSRSAMKTQPLAGGTYLLGLQDDTIQAVVDLRDLELAYISEDARGVHIGAMTTLQAMVDSHVLKEFAAGLLSRASQVSSFSRLIRESATLGGTLVAGIASQADLLTALSILDAQAVLRSASKTQVNLSAGTAEHPGLALSGVTFKGKQERRVACNSINKVRQPNELIIEVIIPRPNYICGTSFMRIGRTPTDIALLNAAALIEVKDGVYSQVRLALGGVNMEPVRMYAVEKQLAEQPVEAEATAQNEGADMPVIQLQRAVQAGMADFQPPSDFRASSDYRHESGMHLAYRALEEAANISRWRSIAGRNQIGPYGRS